MLASYRSVAHRQSDCNGETFTQVRRPLDGRLWGIAREEYYGRETMLADTLYSQHMSKDSRKNSALRDDLPRYVLAIQVHMGIWCMLL